MGRPSRYDSLSPRDFEPGIRHPGEGDVFYGCTSYEPKHDLSMGRQDATGLWHPGEDRRASAAQCRCGNWAEDGSRRYCERCGKFGQDGTLATLPDLQPADTPAP